jgi:hypothetical protein
LKQDITSHRRWPELFHVLPLEKAANIRHAPKPAS